MDLSNLRPADGSKQSDNFRRGRGHGSGNGKTAGKGHKGQKARSGAPRPGFEGGQMPLYRRIPKRGFTNRNSKTIVGINVSALEVFEDGATVSVETLIESGIVKNPKDGVKILGNGELIMNLTVQANSFSASAKYKIEEMKIDNSQIKSVRVKKSEIKKIKPKYSSNQKVLLPKNSNKITYKYKFKKEVKAPIKAGDTLGEVEVYSNNNKISTIPLKSDKNVKSVSF